MENHLQKCIGMEHVSSQKDNQPTLPQHTLPPEIAGLIFRAC